jgi:tetratricopeptide (TPR) repeat protein
MSLRGSKHRRKAMLSMAFLLSSTLLAQSAPEGRGALELTSQLGRPLYALPNDATVTTARTNLAADPKNPVLVLKLSKAEASRRQYKEAVATCTEGLAAAPDNADLYLERGHRELGLREFKQAQKDLERAVEIDPSKLDSHYHLGLAHYFQGQFHEAAIAFDKARALAKSDDSLIDCSNWLYVSLRRAGEDAQASQVLARITPQVKNTEPHLFFYLQLLHFYQGKVTAEAVLPPKPTTPGDTESELSFDTVSYGVGNWKLYHHDVPGAKALFNNVVTGEAWNAWGFIGSETDLFRLGR